MSFSFGFFTRPCCLFRSAKPQPNVFLKDVSSTSSVVKDQQLIPVNCEVRHIQKEQLESEETQSRNAKITTSKENAASNNTITAYTSTEAITSLKYISHKMIMPVGKTNANNNTFTGNTVTGLRASWSENSKPVDKKK